MGNKVSNNLYNVTTITGDSLFTILRRETASIKHFQVQLEPSVPASYTTTLVLR